MNEQGERCALQSTLVSQFTQTQVACSLTNTTCTEGCTQALEDFSDVGGCCVNNLFNGSLAGITSQRFDFLGFEFWSNCGVDTLGTCEVRLNDATTQQISVATPSSAPSDGAITVSDSATDQHIYTVWCCLWGSYLHSPPPPPNAQWTDGPVGKPGL